MDVFDELNNHLYINACFVFSRITRGEGIFTEKSLRESLTANYDYSYAWPDDMSFVDEFISFFLNLQEKLHPNTTLNHDDSFSEDYSALLSVLHTPKDFILDFSKNDLTLLANLINTKEASIFIPTALLKKLKSILKEYMTEDAAEWWKVTCYGNNTIEDYCFISLKTFYQAILDHRQIQYTLKNKAKRTAVPYRIEYDIAYHIYNFLVLLPQKGKIERFRLQDICELKLLDQIFDESDTKKNVEKYLAENKCTVTLKLLDEKNAIERCLRLFASFDKETWCDADRKTYEMQLSFYPFDKESVIQRILSLNPMAVVIEPENIRTEIVTRLKTMQRIYLNK